MHICRPIALVSAGSLGMWLCLCNVDYAGASYLMDHTTLCACPEADRLEYSDCSV